MKNLKRSRTLSLLAGSLFLINTIIALEGNLFILVPILFAIAGILSWVSVYIIHKRITKDNNE
ncbi:hypothetical protein DES36_1176 [Alkalibaculum bacchi]|uniref:Uncharacterized protein n=1 Tax=Alkalibaculum bacchi TaxID=645887 RepID=A0A366I2B0_9FIRM|nr:hypothetical protein [Alkalibaculum bacchi]RBP59912.1 hypothetical protein DES36_1176 [Alkalibaculum bacchi]